MDYVIGYLFISAGFSVLVTVAGCCYYGWKNAEVPEDPIDDEEAFNEFMAREHKRLNELWIWRKVDSADGHE